MAEIQIVEQGGLYVARYEGRPNRTFGKTPKDAQQKLTSSDWTKISCDGRKRRDASVPSVYAGKTPGGHLLFKEVETGVTFLSKEEKFHVQFRQAA